VEMRARVSPVGAMGLMQIMPIAWAGSRSRRGVGVDPFDARDDILAGVAYSREMHDRCGPSGFLATYNAGPKRYEEYLATGRALPTEMQLYVTIPAPMIGGTPVEGTLVIARRAIPWQEAAPFAARGCPGSPAGSFSPFPPIDRATAGRSLASELALQPRVAGLFVGRASAGRSL
jgi:hypothetical protein